MEMEIMNENDMNILFQNTRNRIDTMYHRLNTMPNLEIKVFHLVVVDDENEEITEFIRSETYLEDDGYVIRKFYRMFVTTYNSLHQTIYCFMPNQREAVIKNFAPIQVNSQQDIRDVNESINQLYQHTRIYPDFYTNIRPIYNTMALNMFLIQYNTLSNETAMHLHYKENIQEYQ
jgi:hypothetical protein